MKITDLLLADAKAALDFAEMDILKLESKARAEGIDPDRIPAYPEVLEVHRKLYDHLLNLTRPLK